MTDAEHQLLFATVAARLTSAILKCAQELQAQGLTFTELGEIWIGAGCGIMGLDLGPAATVEKLHSIANGIARAAVNPSPTGRVN